MLRALCIGLVLGIVASSTEVQTQKTWADQAEAATEVKRLCGTGDIDGALNVLDAHGQPIGWQHGKEILNTCFMDGNGECLVGKAKCAWMKKCLGSEGPCEQVPVAEALLELPGGKAVFEELQFETNSSDSAPISKLVDAAKKLSKAMGGSSLLQEPKTPKGHEEASNTTLYAVKKALWYLKGARDIWFKYLPEKSQKQLVLDLAAGALYFKAACGTTFRQKFDEETNRPLYGFYKPLGEKGPSYTAPLYHIESKGMDPNKWICTYPKKLKKWQKREVATAEAQKQLQKEKAAMPAERKALRRALTKAHDEDEVMRRKADLADTMRQ